MYVQRPPARHGARSGRDVVGVEGRGSRARQYVYTALRGALRRMMVVMRVVVAAGVRARMVRG